MSIPTPRPAARAVPGTRRAALLAHLRERGGAMSVAELAADIGLHQNTVRAHLDRLVGEGRVERTTERRATRGRPRELYSATGAPEPHESYAQLAAVLAAQLESLGESSLAIDAGRRWAQWEQRGEDLPRGADDPGEIEGSSGSPGSTGTGAPAGLSGVTRTGAPAGLSGVAGTGEPAGLSQSTGLEPSSATSASDEVLRVLRRTGFAPERAADGTILLHHCPFGAVAREHADVVCGAHLGLIQGTLDQVSPGSRAELIPFADPQTCIARIAPDS